MIEWNGRVPFQPPPPQTPIKNAEPRASRNDPCPCGRGRKHKRCCVPARELAAVMRGSARATAYVDAAHYALLARFYPPHRSVLGPGVMLTRGRDQWFVRPADQYEADERRTRLLTAGVAS